MNDSIRDRLARWPWAEIDRALLDAGHARVANTLSPDECVGLAEAYPDERLFRSRVDMARHAFGVGEYKYFADPLPPLVAELRQCA